MRSKKLLVIPVALALFVAALAGSDARADNPGAKAKKAIAVKQAQARQVLSEIASIDEELNMVSEQYDGARYKLGVIRKRLAGEQVQLAAAQKRYTRAQNRAARLAVYLYTSNHSSSLDVILGARSISELLRLSDAEHQLSLQATFIINQTQSAKRELELAVATLDRDRTAAVALVKQVASVRTQILTGLDERRKLLATVQHQVGKLVSAERARQAKLAAIARARLEAELAAERQAAVEAAAKRQAEIAAAQKAEAEQAAAALKAKTLKAAEAQQAQLAAEQAATTTTTAAAADPGAANGVAVSSDGTTTAVLPPTSTLPGVTTVPAPVITGPLPAGHPEAAQLALAYLGVPYVWGGGTPTGFDCSGLVSYVYAQLGIALPHFAAAQYTLGAAVPADQLQPGDLVFFDKLDHVGIYLGDSLFIDAPHTGAFVRIDSLNEKWYAKKYVGARRI